jgi:hypothetical protein
MRFKAYAWNSIYKDHSWHNSDIHFNLLPQIDICLHKHGLYEEIKPGWIFSIMPSWLFWGITFDLRGGSEAEE